MRHIIIESSSPCLRASFDHLLMIFERSLLLNCPTHRPFVLLARVRVGEDVCGALVERY